MVSADDNLFFNFFHERIVYYSPDRAQKPADWLKDIT